MRLWDADTGQHNATITTGHGGRVLSVAFSPDGETLASGGRDNTVRLWDAKTGQHKATLGHTHWVYSVAFSPDGQYARKWELTTVRCDCGTPTRVERKPLSRGMGARSRGIRAGSIVSRSVPMGVHSQVVGVRRIRCGCGTPSRVEQKATLTGHTGGVNSVSFSPDGQTLASGSEDGTVLLWDMSEFVSITDEATPLLADVTGDSVVNIFDLVSVASQFGQTGENDADVNRDGVVNIFDLVTVAGAFGAEAAAPSAHPQALAMLTYADVEGWLTQAQGLHLTDATSQRGIIFLEQLLEALTPKETALLPNYPNPFNPETWIPYHLAHAADVTLTIYDTKGAPVRQLDLGHQSAGYYTARTKAAYWDGRNDRGESGGKRRLFLSTPCGSLWTLGASPEGLYRLTADGNSKITQVTRAC